MWGLQNSSRNLSLKYLFGVVGQVCVKAVETIALYPPNAFAFLLTKTNSSFILTALFFFVCISKRSILSLQALRRLPGAPAPQDASASRLPTGPGILFKVLPLSPSPPRTFFIAPRSFDFTTLKPRNVAAVSLLIRCQRARAPWGGHLHNVSAATLGVFKKGIITADRNEPALSEQLFGQFISLIAIITFF